MKKVLFYGSLKKGHFNFDRFERFGKQKYVKSLVIDDFDLYSLGAYPAATRGKRSLHVELHELDDSVFYYVEKMEESALYHSENIEVEGEYATIFLMDIIRIKSLRGKLIKSGNW